MIYKMKLYLILRLFLITFIFLVEAEKITELTISEEDGIIEIDPN